MCRWWHLVLQLASFLSSKSGFHMGPIAYYVRGFKSKALTAAMKWNQMAEFDTLHKYITLLSVWQKHHTDAGCDSCVFNTLCLHVKTLSQVFILLMSWPVQNFLINAFSIVMCEGSCLSILFSSNKVINSNFNSWQYSIITLSHSAYSSFFLLSSHTHQLCKPSSPKKASQRI